MRLPGQGSLCLDLAKKLNATNVGAIAVAGRGGAPEELWTEARVLAWVMLHSKAIFESTAALSGEVAFDSSAVRSQTGDTG